MKTSTITIAPYRHHIKRKSRRRTKKVQNSAGLYPETGSVSVTYFSEDKIDNKILFYTLVKHQHQ